MLLQGEYSHKWFYILKAFKYLVIKSASLRSLYRKYFELAFWIAALTSLATMTPGTDPHYSFCIFRLLGIKFCPGCGLGHSVGYLFHGDIQASFSAHPLGIFAVIIIVRRIYHLSWLHIFSKTIKRYHGLQ